jgi:hypothetical protein
VKESWRVGELEREDAMVSNEMEMMMRSQVVMIVVDLSWWSDEQDARDKGRGAAGGGGGRREQADSGYIHASTHAHHATSSRLG